MPKLHMRYIHQVVKNQPLSLVFRSQNSMPSQFSVLKIQPRQFLL